MRDRTRIRTRMASSRRQRPVRSRFRHKLRTRVDRGNGLGRTTRPTCANAAADRSTLLLLLLLLLLSVGEQAAHGHFASNPTRCEFHLCQCCCRFADVNKGDGWSTAVRQGSGRRDECGAAAAAAAAGTSAQVAARLELAGLPQLLVELADKHGIDLHEESGQSVGCPFQNIASRVLAEQLRKSRFFAWQMI